MEKTIIAKEELSLEEYVQKIKAKKIYHNELPEEIRDEIVIINAEVAAKMRRFEHRGYDVIRNRFFIHQTIKVKNYRDEIDERDDNKIFDTFDEYYEYLNGDIYDSACYYQYVFSKEMISKYSIDLSKISTSAFIDDTLTIRSQIADKEELETIKSVKQKNASLIKWKNKFCASNTYEELLKVAKAFQKIENKDWEYVLSSFVLFNKEKNTPLVIRFMLETDYFKSEIIMTMLCVQYGDDSILDCFSKYHWRKKSEIKSLIKGLSDGTIIAEYSKYYDRSTGFFCVRHSIVDTKATKYSRRKGYITHFYNSFSEFAEACNYDLSDAKLSMAPVDEIELSEVYINNSTELPLSSIKNPYYNVNKYYDAKKDTFVVEEIWRANANSPILKNRKHTFKQLVNFVAFLEGDLSNADLLLCDGLSFVTDFSNINLDGALLVSSIKGQAGLLDKNEIIHITRPNFLENTASTELMYVDEYIPIHEELSFSEKINRKKICYISDLHLSHHIHSSDVRTREDVISVIKKSVIELTKDINITDILIIVGDTTFDISCFSMFVNILKDNTSAKVIFVLGNHELWGFENITCSKIISIYKDIIEGAGMYLLQNNILFCESESRLLEEITEEELIASEKSHLRDRLKYAQIIIFGGIGFSGLNQNFNADYGIYRKALNRESEIKESHNFESLYTKVRNYLPEREVIIATHMPLNDWSHDVEYHSGYIYISGHTHRNEFYDDGIKRIYADNQVGYYRKQFCVKSLYIEGKYDLFDNYNDGIYEITRSEYIDFYRGKNIKMDFNRDFEHLYMLKRDGYYCFIIQTIQGKLSILNGGSTKIIKNKTIESCYDDMLEIIETIKSPLDAFTGIQKQISNFVKSIGGEGRIHGAIIDIDALNHIYVNPNDLKVTGYFALSMVEKMVFGSIQDLLTQCRPELLPAYNNYLNGDTSTALVLKQNSDNSFVSKPYYSTDIYTNSNVLKKMQRLYSNILTIWPDKNHLSMEKDESIKMIKDQKSTQGEMV